MPGPPSVVQVVTNLAIGGTERQVGTRSLNLWDVRFGLGTEYSFRYVAPFVDVLGDMQYVNAAMTVDGETAQYKAWTFGFVVRGGMRIHMGDNLFLETAASGPAQVGVPNADGTGDLMQGYLEMANVNSVTEIADLIAAQRAYEMNARVISGADQMMQATSQLR